MADPLKLAAELGQARLTSVLLGPQSATNIADVRRGFLIEEVNRGSLPTVVFVPGFYRIHLRALAEWFEEVPTALIEANRKGLDAEDRCQELFYAQSTWQQQYAWRLTSYAVKQGYIERGRCLVCGNVAAAHHPDYAAPFNILWLCTSHHSSEHKRLKRLAKVSDNAIPPPEVPDAVSPSNTSRKPARLITIAELCEWLQASPKYIEAEVSRGNLRVLRMSNKMVRFAWADIEAWLASKAV